MLIIPSFVYGDEKLQSPTIQETIYYGLPYDFSEYSIYTAKSYGTLQWTSAVYGSLLKRTNSTSMPWEPDLAKDLPDVSNNGLTFTFTLREKLKFSNGESLTADDINFSLNMALTPKINLAGYSRLAPYLVKDSFTAISSSKFSITLTKTSPFPYNLLSFPIVPQGTYHDQYDSCMSGILASCVFDNSDGSSAISAGPFKVSEINKYNQTITVVANPYWYDATHLKTDKIIFEKIASKESAINALISGSIDIMDSHYVPKLTELNGLNVQNETIVDGSKQVDMALNNLNPYYGTGELIPVVIEDTNLHNGIFNKTLGFEKATMLRHAMSSIMDNGRTIFTEYYENLALPIATLMPQISFGFDPTLKAETYNLTNAREIMKSLGFDYGTLGAEDPSTHKFSRGFFNMTVFSGNSSPDVFVNFGDMAQRDLATIGITAEWMSIGFGGIWNRIFNLNINPPSYSEGGYDAVIMYYGFKNFEWNPISLFDATGNCTTGNCLNFYNFDLNETLTPVANVVRDYLATLDYNLKFEYIHELQKLLLHYLPEIPLVGEIGRLLWSHNTFGIDTKLLSVAHQDWSLVSKNWFQLNSYSTSKRASLSMLDMVFIGFPVLIFLKRKRNNNLPL